MDTAAVVFLRPPQNPHRLRGSIRVRVQNTHTVEVSQQ